ncbi:multiple epidermal growth factor-like domains protein 10 isoform X2 [Haliotis rufescens]|uniref:multiple epidermal growth factor-like domains protein 10 isoform X2 n=1 Tax=Haliotis rufescens TaxID=6454 RepID=UPI00201F7BB0|nr:multiple epidermal growth factor-like domains protein 10 isoform X2 [Haliotis rufescens]
MSGVWILTVTVLTSAFWMQVIIGISCPIGRFGDTCSYSCHCTPTCNQTTGVCSGACDPGWFGGNGQTCQKGNVAFNKTATSSITNYAKDSWTADKVVDGNRDQYVSGNSCFHSTFNQRAMWTVDLGQQYRIHDVRIYNRVGHIERIRTAVLSLSNSSSPTPGVNCYTFPSDTAKTNNSVYDVPCGGTGRYFTITHSTVLNLCEVEIYVCSPGVFGDSCTQFCHCLQATCDPVSGVCPGYCRPGWQGERCDTACSSGSYGQSCSNSCTDRKCAGDSPCDHVRGTCVSGCEPGWMGEDCREACSSGSYGQSCSNSCTDRKCAGDSPCDHVRGTCVSGCEPGWMGEDCREACTNGSYGQNCSHSCIDRKCAGDSPCDHIRGTCVSGCKPGSMDEDCREACDINHYGANCDKTCASRHCVGNSSCSATGNCDRGCDTGWAQADCTEDARCVQPAGYNANQLAVAVVLVFVAGDVVGAIVSAVIWRRRNRCLHKTSESRPTTVSLVPTEPPQASDDVGPETRPYDSLNAVSYDAKMKGEPYCTVKSGQTNAKTDATVLTSCDVSDSIAAGTYETLDNTSRGTDGEYSEIGKVK